MSLNESLCLELEQNNNNEKKNQSYSEKKVNAAHPASLIVFGL